MKPKRYRMRPVVMVEAVQIESEPVSADELVPNPNSDNPGGEYDEEWMWAPPPEELQEIAEWAGSKVTTGVDRIHEVEVPTKMGPFYARTGDWIVKEGDSGYFQVLDDETFRKVYERVGI